jgi:hypothetical protein
MGKTLQGEILHLCGQNSKSANEAAENKSANAYMKNDPVMS